MYTYVQIALCEADPRSIAQVKSINIHCISESTDLPHKFIVRGRDFPAQELDLLAVGTAQVLRIRTACLPLTAHDISHSAPHGHP